MIFSHMANYFRNENLNFPKLRKRELDTNRKIQNRRILIIKLKVTFTYLQLMNILLDCEDFSFLKFQKSRFENS